MSLMNSPLYGNYRYRKFTDIYEDVDAFITDYTDICVNKMGITAFETSDAQRLFYLLYARYGNSTIASSDETQFKFKLFSIIFSAGPSWKRKLDAQRKLLQLNDEDIRLGSKAIYNHALNPSTAPSTASLTELTKIDDQNTTNYLKSQLEGYSALIELIKDDVTGIFLDKFKKLFLVFVNPEGPLWYISENTGDK